MKRGITGRYEISRFGGEEVRAFIPQPLPPHPPLQLNGDLQKLLERAQLALGRLDSVTLLLPDPDLFLYAYIRREAVLSSQIEGTQSSLADLLLFELQEVPGVPVDDVQEVSNYIAAMEHGIRRLQEGFPLCNRLLREMHEKLLARGRGSDKMPGEFRRSQNWIGGTRPGDAHFVPPPPHHVEQCMADLEIFLHDDTLSYPALVKAALAHVQFETIHPFLDGNGRIGRLLISFILHHEGVLTKPLLYLSLYFKQHRQEYYRLLDIVRWEGDWEAWLRFFLEGVETTANNAVQAARRLMELFGEDALRVQHRARRRASSALRVLEAFKQRPLLTLPQICQRSGLSFPTATKGVQTLEQLDIVRELTGRQRGRVFVYEAYLHILNEGTVPQEEK